MDKAKQEIELQGEQRWSEVLRPKDSLFNIRLGELWRYRDLVQMFVMRDFVATYKQTILGPIWFFIQPVLTTIMFAVVFGGFARLSSDGMPRLLFYLSALTIWNYFSECFTKTSSVFITNASIFGKVYFPRMIIPISIVVSNLLKFLIQFSLFLGFLFYYLMDGGYPVKPNLAILLLPVLIIIMAGISLGAGMIFSAMTTKYRDLTFLLTFGVQLLMYATPVIYSVQSIPEKYRYWVMLNPLSPVVETFRYAFLGTGQFSINSLLYSGSFMVVLLMISVVIFNRVERTFMDTV
jgi:lipopolysaccharide transport system permease protein